MTKCKVTSMKDEGSAGCHTVEARKQDEGNKKTEGPILHPHHTWPTYIVKLSAVTYQNLHKMRTIMLVLFLTPVL